MHIWRLCVFFIGWFTAASMASAQERIALVIGNEAYRAAVPLENPVADADAVSASLERLGFEVIKALDVDHGGFREAVRSFSDRLQDAEIALFFYAGHGLQVNGRNYLLPVDADLKSETDLDFSAIDVDLVLRQMERHDAVKLVFLDACRSNPFEQALSRAMGATRAVGALGRGLAPIDARGGVLIGFATDPGATASDGAGDNSPFTEALIRHIETPGLEINVMMTRVRADVFSATGQTQRPWVSTSLLGEVYLAPRGVDAAETELTPPASSALELSFWQSIAASRDPDEYAAYLEAFPEGIFASLAKRRISALTAEGGQSAEMPPPAGPAAGDAAETPPGLQDTETATVSGSVSASTPTAPAVPGEPLEAVAGSAPQPEPVETSPEMDEQLALSATQRPVPRPSTKPAPPEPETDVNCPKCPVMLPLAGGTFVMGSPPGVGEATERPQRRITLAPFAISRSEITIAQYRAFIEASGYRPAGGCYVWTADGKMRRSASASWRNPGYDLSDASPVACVSWEDAERYVAWLNEVTNGGYRLASEAEFEFAARAGSEGAYFWGAVGGVCEAVNGAGAESRFRWRNKACDDGTPSVASIGTYPANLFGLTDMIGNLWEWTADCWNPSHQGADATGKARTTGQCKSRVLRGGSWDDPIENLRSAYRVGIPANRRQANVGFRVVRTAAEN